jgi:hypothetical protein
LGQRGVVDSAVVKQSPAPRAPAQHAKGFALAPPLNNRELFRRDSRDHIEPLSHRGIDKSMNSSLLAPLQ